MYYYIPMESYPKARKPPDSVSASSNAGPLAAAEGRVKGPALRGVRKYAAKWLRLRRAGRLLGRYAFDSAEREGNLPVTLGLALTV